MEEILDARFTFLFVYYCTENILWHPPLPHILCLWRALTKLIYWQAGRVPFSSWFWMKSLLYICVKYDFRDGTFTLKHHLKIFHSFTLTIPVLKAQRRVRFLIGYYSLCNMLYIELPCFIILLLVCTIRCLSALAHACEEFRRRRLLKYSLANFSRPLLNQGGRCIKHKVTILGTCVIDQRAIS